MAGSSAASSPVFSLRSSTLLPEGVTDEGTRIMQQGAHVICLQQIQWSIDGDRTITGSCGRWVGEPRDVIGDG